MKNLLYLNRYFLKYKYRLLIGIVMVAASNYFSVLIPQEIREALDYVLDKSSIYKAATEAEQPALYESFGEALFIFGLTVIGLMILKGIFMYFMRQTIIVMSRLIEYDLRKDIFGHLETMDLAFYKKNKTGDLMSRVSEDVSKVRMYVGPALLYGINLVSLFVLTIGAMIHVSPTLTLYTLIPLPFLSVSIYYVSRMINRKSSLIQQQLGSLTSFAQETYSGIRVIKSYGKEQQFNDRFGEENEVFKRKSMDLAQVNALFFPIMILLISASNLLVIYVGGLEVAKGNISTGNIAEFVMYVNMLTWPVTSIGWIASLIQQAEASQERINELLFEKSALSKTGTVTTPIQGHIRFDNVSFTYPDTGVEALKNVSFDLAAGQKMAIIGKTAAGKSTIADLLIRMYDNDTGTIYLDDTPLPQHQIDRLRKRIGYVPQDVFLFSDTVSSNIAFGKRDATQQQIEEYAAYAAIDKEIKDLPKGYDTFVGERGVTLSGGQKQRISIARAFIKDPDIVILDDCLSAVDTDTEQRIMSYLNVALENKTAIIITHRVHNLLSFDKILVLDNGRVAEYGTPEELVKANGYYSELLETQSLQESV